MRGLETVCAIGGAKGDVGHGSAGDGIEGGGDDDEVSQVAVGAKAATTAPVVALAAAAAEARVAVAEARADSCNAASFHAAPVASALILVSARSK